MPKKTQKQLLIYQGKSGAIECHDDFDEETIWVTKVLKQHILQGYTINKKRIGKNYEKFMQAVADVKALLPAGNRVTTEDVLELINAFAGTWFSLDAYDADSFPHVGTTKKKVRFTADELSEALTALTLLIAESKLRDKDKMVGDGFVIT